MSKLNTTPDYRNDVTLTGKITYVYHSNATTFFTIRTFTGKINTPQVRFYGNMKDKVAGFAVGDYVTVKGRIASIKKEENTIRWPNQFIVGNEIEAVAPIMETAFNKEATSDRPNYPSENVMYLAGRILHASKPADNVQNYLFYTESLGKVSIIQLTQYVDPKATPFAKGDFVNIYGTVQTSPKEKDGKPYMFTNFVISEIQKIN